MTTYLLAVFQSSLNSRNKWSVCTIRLDIILTANKMVENENE